MNEEETKKKLLVKKVEQAAEEIRSKQKKEESNRYVDEHLSVLKKREDPYKIVMKNKINGKNKRIIITAIIGVATLVLLAFVILSRGTKNSD